MVVLLFTEIKKKISSKSPLCLLLLSKKASKKDNKRDIMPQKKMTSSLIIKGILLQYGGFLVAMLAVAITVLSPRSEALFGISTTTCLLIGALLLLSLIFFVLSFFFRLFYNRLEFFALSPNDAL